MPREKYTIRMLLFLLLLFSTVNLSQNSDFATIQHDIINVTASSTSDSRTDPNNTIDGKGFYDGESLSRWSTYGTPQWIMFDLGSIKSVSKTKFSFFKFDKGRVYTYMVECSKEGRYWNRVVDQSTSGSSEFTEDKFEKVECRYVKLTLIKANNSKWAALWEAEIHGTLDNEGPTLKNIDVLTDSSLILTFSEKLQHDSAIKISNYIISNGIQVNSIEYDDNKIKLNTNMHLAGNYQISISNIYDVYGNSIDENTIKNYTVIAFTPDPIPEPTPSSELLSIVDVFASETSDPATSPEGTIDGKGRYDGDNYSRWASKYFPQWIVFDLGEIKNITKVSFSFYRFDEGRTYNYKVLGSDDNSNWRTIIENAQSSSTEYSNHTLTNTKFRYIKLEVNDCNNSEWVSLWEIKIYGNTIETSESDEPIVNKAQIKVVKVEASSTTDKRTAPEYTIDGKGFSDNDPHSRWSSKPTPQYLIFDFGSEKVLTESHISFYNFEKNRVYNYSLHSSSDKFNWTTILSNQSSELSEWTKNTLNNLKARYIKLIINSNNQNDYACIWEAKFFGTDYIEPPSFTKTTIKVDVSKGWNIISLPIIPEKSKTNEVFENQNSSDAFNFDEFYVEHETIKSGLGYWVRFEDNHEFSIEGYSSSKDIELKEGWNMIGTMKELHINDLITEPANIIQSLFYGFDGNYRIKETLEVGKGYWIKCSQSGLLKQSTNNNTSSSLSKIYSMMNNNLLDITVTDKNNNTMTLYLSETNHSLNKIYLPPIPPDGAFDVRFSSGEIIHSITEINNKVLMKDVTYPVRISTNSNNLAIKYFSNGEMISENLTLKNTISISDDQITEFDIIYNTIPSEYKLDQNFPNPFNPSTTIQYNLPIKTFVNLSIFNMLGEKVTTLVNAIEEAGSKKIKLNTTDLSSGVYIYVLKTDSFIEAKKMTLIK